MNGRGRSNLIERKRMCESICKDLIDLSLCEERSPITAGKQCQRWSCFIWWFGFSYELMIFTRKWRKRKQKMGGLIQELQHRHLCKRWRHSRSSWDEESRGRIWFQIFCLLFCRPKRSSIFKKNKTVDRNDGRSRVFGRNEQRGSYELRNNR